MKMLKRFFAFLFAPAPAEGQSHKALGPNMTRRIVQTHGVSEGVRIAQTRARTLRDELSGKNGALANK